MTLGSSAGPQILDLMARLRAVRRRLAVKRGIHGSLSSIVLAALTYLALDSYRALSGDSLRDGFALAVALTVLVVGVLGVWKYVSLTSPDVISVAILVEQRLGFAERLSTSIEVATKGLSPSVIERALLDDAAIRGARVRPNELVSVSVPRELLHATLSIIAVVAAWWLPLTIEQWRASVPLVAGVSQQERVEAALRLQSAAAVVRRQALQRDDPRLQSLAARLEALGAAVHDASTDDRAVAAEYARILSDVAEAFGLADSSDTSGADRGMAERPPAWDGAVGAEPPTDDAAARVPEGSLGEHEANLDLRDYSGRLDELISQIDAEPLDGGAGGAERTDFEAGESGAGFFDYDEVNPEMTARLERARTILASLRPEVPLGGDVGGAGEGASIQPGAGSEPLFGVGSEPAGAGALVGAPGEDVELPADASATRRTRVEAPPETEYAAVEAESLIRGSWRRFEERPVPKDSIGLAHRDVVRRYFLSPRSEGLAD